MSLREQIQTDMIASTKARDQVKTDCLRMAISALKYKEQDKKVANAGKDLPLVRCAVGFAHRKKRRRIDYPKLV